MCITQTIQYNILYHSEARSLELKPASITVYVAQFKNNNYIFFYLLYQPINDTIAMNYLKTSCRIVFAQYKQQIAIRVDLYTTNRLFRRLLNKLRQYWRDLSKTRTKSLDESTLKTV